MTQTVVTQTASWGPIATGCRAVIERADSISARIVARISEEIGPYEQALLSEHDHREAVREHMHMVLGGVAERREPGAAELEFARSLGRLRAQQGLPLHALIQAYHVGYEELWTELRHEVQRACGSNAAALPDAASNAWRWVHEISSAVAEAYAESSEAGVEAEMKLGRRFVDMLTLANAPAGELFDVARSLGFEPDGSFQALSVVAEGLSARQAERIAIALGNARCTVVQNDRLLVLWQGGNTADIRAVLARLVPERPAGIGLRRTGLAGARLCIGDAERALAIACRRGSDADFATEWLSSAMLESEDRLQAVLEPGLDVAREHPELLETVCGFAEANFSVAAMARAHYLHPNTATYRLERWRALTGWNPRTFDGLLKSLACAQLHLREAH